MIEDLTEFLNRSPFLPFGIILTSGTRYDVTSPLQVVIVESRMRFYSHASDRQAVIRLNQVAALETLQEKWS